MTSRSRLKRPLWVALFVCLAWMFAPSPVAGKGERLQVIVTASHHHVLPYWYRAARRGALPRSGLTVVHLDAHPDLAVPARPIPPGFPRLDGSHQNSIDIASFQLAAVRAGLVGRVLWLRPAWADQIPDGEHRFRLGTAAGGSLRVDSDLDYYVLNDAWSATELLRETAPVELRVLPLGPPAPAEAGLLVAAGKPYVLDIDLDIFSTRNPSVDRLETLGFTREEVAVVRRVFARTNLDLAREPRERIENLRSIETAIAAVTAGGLWNTLSAAFTLWWYGISPLEMAELMELLDGKSYEQLDALLREGRTVVGVPVHRSEQAEIEAALAALEDLTSRRLERPALVTIARSMRDGFTHPYWLGPVETGVLEVLERTAGPLRIVYDRDLEPLE